jgi:gliding motility-associated-like protein
MVFRLLRIFLFIFLTGLTELAFSQCSITSSLFCHDAPVICELACLDGFTGNMPDELIQPQPPSGKLCTDGGRPDNMSWFAFVAGSEEIELRLDPYNCVRTDPTYFGLQAGIFTSCDFSLDIRDLVVACSNELDNSPQPITLYSDEFVPGQIYYFYVDGQAGTICDYEITVLQGAQPFPLESIDSIRISNNQNDTIDGEFLCLGSRNVNITALDSNFQEYGLNIEYNWSITPSNPDYPLGNHPETTSTTRWNFNHPGVYEICVYADNRCDQTDLKCRTVYVDTIPDQDFGLIEVCSNGFPFPGPSDIDLYGDGELYSWQGFNINAPGVYEYNAILSTGCRFLQRVEVNSIVQNPRIPLTLVTCDSLQFNGLTYASDVRGVPINIFGAAANGCDSLVSLDIYVLNLEGQFRVGACASGSIPLSFEVTNVNAPSGYELEYIWRNGAGNVLSVSEEADSIIHVTEVGNYILEVTIKYQDVECIIPVGSRFVDPDGVLPVVPSPDLWPSSFCEGDILIPMSVNAVGDIEGFIWTVPEETEVVFPGTNQGVIFLQIPPDFSHGEVCVSTFNSCGESAELCTELNRVAMPELDIEIPSDICAGQDIVFRVTGDTGDGASWLWDQIGGQVVSPRFDEDSIIIRYNSAGANELFLFPRRGECVSPTVARIVEVNQRIDEPTITCRPTSNSIQIEWEVDDCASEYVLFINGEVQNIDMPGSFSILDLQPETIVDFRLLAKSDCPCGDVEVQTNCETYSCGGGDVKIINPAPIICEVDWGSEINLGLNITGMNSSGVIEWQGTYVDEFGNFNPAEAGAGTHTVYVLLNDLNCLYSDSVVFQLIPQPDFDYSTLDPECVEDILGTIRLSNINIVGDYTVLLDDEEIEGMEIEAGIGEHTIILIDGYQCEIIKSIVINAPVVPDFEIEGDETGFDNGTLNFQLSANNAETINVDSVAWFINGEIYCSGSDCFKLTLNNFSAGSYVHQLFIYYKDCVIEESFAFEVKESYKIHYPNVFRPGAGGSNGFWMFYTNDPDLMIDEVSVYSRWGDLVFRKSMFYPNVESQLWDGTVSGRLISPGVYIFSIHYKNEKGEDTILHGDITVIR